MGCLFYNVPKTGTCHMMTRRMHSFYAIKLPRPGTSGTCEKRELRTLTSTRDFLECHFVEGAWSTVVGKRRGQERWHMMTF